MKTEQENKNVQAYVAYKISKMQHLNTRHFWLSVFCCIYLTLIGGFLIYVAFESVWTCLAISILNIVLTIPPFIVKGKTNRLIFSLASFSVTFSTVMLTLGAYCIISIDNDYLFVYWFVVLVAHILISQLVTWRRIKHGYYLNVNVRKKVVSGVGYSMAGVFGIMAGRVMFASASQYVIRLIVSLIIIWVVSMFVVLAIQLIQVYFLKKKLGTVDENN